MKNQNNSSKQLILLYGLTLGVLGVLNQLILFATGTIYDPHWSSTAILFCITVIVLVLGIKKHKTVNNGYLKLREALRIGIGISLISGIIVVGFTLLFTTVIEPDYYTNILEVSRSKILEQYPNWTDEQIETALKFPKMMKKPSISISLGITTSVFLGFIISLIAGLIMKKSKEEITQI